MNLRLMFVVHEHMYIHAYVVVHLCECLHAASRCACTCCLPRCCCCCCCRQRGKRILRIYGHGLPPCRRSLPLLHAHTHTTTTPHYDELMFHTNVSMKHMHTGEYIYERQTSALRSRTQFIEHCYNLHICRIFVQYIKLKTFAIGWSFPRSLITRFMKRSCVVLAGYCQANLKRERKKIGEYDRRDVPRGAKVSRRSIDTKAK